MSDIPPYRQPAKPIAERVEDLLRRMTLEEKIGQVNMPSLPGVLMGRMAHELLDRPGAGDDAALDPDALAEAPPEAIARTAELCEPLVLGELERGLGPIGGLFGLYGSDQIVATPVEQQQRLAELQQLARQRTRLGIPLLQIAEGCHGVMTAGATIFPEGPALGSSWDPDLIRDVYHAAAREARAVGMHMLTTLVVEPIREPRLGRNCEGYSECPRLTRDIAFAIVAGVQGDDPSAADRAAASLTAFPGQSEPISGMERGAMDLSERAFRATWMPAWAAVSGPGGAMSVMATYAAIDSVPIHASTYWLTDVLREELGFEGFVLSEGFGFETLLYEGVAETQKEAGAVGLAAGVDVSITHERAFLEPLRENVEDGVVPADLIDRAVRRVLEVKFRLGLFDEPAEPDVARAGAVHGTEHLELALRAAREGIVLLRNEWGLLPLSRDLRSLAVVGPLADDGRSLLGDYVVPHVIQPIETVVEALRRKLGAETEIVHERGCDVTDPDDAGIAAAVAAAAGAEVAIVVVGERSRWFFDRDSRATVGELSDVRSLDLSGRQEELVQAVQATGTPTIVVLVNGRALSICWAAENVPGIVMAWLPGERGAQAIVEVLFGEHDPGGRLPVTIPAHVGQLPVYYNHKPSKRHCLRDGAYVDGTGEPLYPFGHGLSYTTFEYGELELRTPGTGDALAELEVRVRNVGDRVGKEVVQLYVADRVSSVTTPVMELRGFRKVPLEPGEEATVSFTLTALDLALVDIEGRLVVEPGAFDVMVGGSSVDIRGRTELRVHEPIVLAEAPRS